MRTGLFRCPLVPALLFLLPSYPFFSPPIVSSPHLPPPLIPPNKVLNPRKPLSPTVRRPGGGGRVNLGEARRSKQTVQRVVRRGG